MSPEPPSPAPRTIPRQQHMQQDPGKQQQSWVSFTEGADPASSPAPVERFRPPPRNPANVGMAMRSLEVEGQAPGQENTPKARSTPLPAASPVHPGPGGSSEREAALGMLVEDTPDGRYIVTGLEEGLPAHLSQKVEVGDNLVAIDGYKVVGTPRAEIARMMYGPEGTKVTLTLRKKGGDVLSTKITRSNMQHGRRSSSTSEAASTPASRPSAFPPPQAFSRNIAPLNSPLRKGSHAVVSTTPRTVQFTPGGGSATSHPPSGTTFTFESMAGASAAPSLRSTWGGPLPLVETNAEEGTNSIKEQFGAQAEANRELKHLLVNKTSEVSHLRAELAKVQNTLSNRSQQTSWIPENGQQDSSYRSIVGVVTDNSMSRDQGNRSAVDIFSLSPGHGPLSATMKPGASASSDTRVNLFPSDKFPGGHHVETARSVDTDIPTTQSSRHVHLRGGGLHGDLQGMYDTAVARLEVAERDHEIAKAGLEARIDDMGRASEREKRAMEREISRLKGMSKQDAEHIDELQAELKAREREAAKTRGDLLQAKKEIQTMSLRAAPQVQTVESAEGLLKLQEEHKAERFRADEAEARAENAEARLKDMQAELQRVRLALHGQGTGDGYTPPTQRGNVVRAGGVPVGTNRVPGLVMQQPDPSAARKAEPLQQHQHPAAMQSSPHSPSKVLTAHRRIDLGAHSTPDGSPGGARVDSQIRYAADQSLSYSSPSAVRWQSTGTRGGGNYSGGASVGGMASTKSPMTLYTSSGRPLSPQDMASFG